MQRIETDGTFLVLVREIVENRLGIAFIITFVFLVPGELFNKLVNVHLTIL